MRNDISKLRDQVQQTFLSPKVTKNELEDNLDGLKHNMEAMMNVNMEDLKDGLKT